MRQVHRAGEKAFVDFSGKRPAIIEAATGEVAPVELFVGVLGASSYVYAEACPAQDLASWITAHVRMVEFFGGAPAMFVPDNLRSGVTHPVATRRSSIAPTSSSLWHRLLRRSVSESGRLRHGDGDHEGAAAAGGG